jgi:hypothetical protein
VLVELTRTVDREGHQLSLTLGQTYEVLGIEADWYRILNDHRDPVLFDPHCFSIVDPVEPAFWLRSLGDDGELYAYPPAWNAPRFFEDFHDRVPRVRAQFWEDLRRYYPRTAYPAA